MRSSMFLVFVLATSSQAAIIRPIGGEARIGTEIVEFEPSGDGWVAELGDNAIYSYGSLHYDTWTLDWQTDVGAQGYFDLELLQDGQLTWSRSRSPLEAPAYLVVDGEELDLPSIATAGRYEASLSLAEGIHRFGFNTTQGDVGDGGLLAFSAPEPSTWVLLVLGLTSLATAAASQLRRLHGRSFRNRPIDVVPCRCRKARVARQ